MRTRTRIYGAAALASLMMIHALLLASLLEILRIDSAIFATILFSMLAVFMVSMIMLLIGSINEHLDQLNK
jgi:isoprenylcysteine carboxyl methyltransferase (ICMT) family protein YpbQ